METDISKLHKGTDGFYYEDYIAPDKPETFVGKLVSTEWWHKGVRFALICNFQAEDGRRIALFAFQKHTGFTGRETVRSISNMWRRIPSGSVKSGNPDGTLYLDERPTNCRTENRRNMIETDRIYLMDCMEGMKQIADSSVDAIIADLPYGVLNRSNPSVNWDRQIPFAALWEQYRRITKPDSPIILFGQGLFSAWLMLSQPRLWRYNLVWQKDRVTGHLNAKRMPLRQHEDILVFYKNSRSIIRR